MSQVSCSICYLYLHFQVTQLQFWQTRFVLDRRTPFDPDYLEALHDLKLKRMACQEQINSYLTELGDISNDAEEAGDI